LLFSCGPSKYLKTVPTESFGDRAESYTLVVSGSEEPGYLDMFILLDREGDGCVLVPAGNYAVVKGVRGDRVSEAAGGILGFAREMRLVQVRRILDGGETVGYEITPLVYYVRHGAPPELQYAVRKKGMVEVVEVRVMHPEEKTGH
jgi:hypothetical protein